MFFPKLLDAPGRSARQQKRADGNEQKQSDADDQACSLHNVGSSSGCASLNIRFDRPGERHDCPDFRVAHAELRSDLIHFKIPQQAAKASYVCNVAAAILPAVESGILPGGLGVWIGKPLPFRNSGPGGKMPPSTTARMAAATDINLKLNM